MKKALLILMIGTLNWNWNSNKKSDLPYFAMSNQKSEQEKSFKKGKIQLSKEIKKEIQ